MPIDPGLLTLAQWLSPAYPVGAFAYSHGLEALVEDGIVHDAQSFAMWLDDILEFGAGRSDAILFVAAFTAPDATTRGDIDLLARALAPSRERLLETDRQGAAFARTTGAIWSTTSSAATYPVAVGTAAAALHLPLEDSLALFLQAFAGNLTSAATRLVPLGQTDAQAVLAARAPMIADMAKAALGWTLDDLGSSCFMSDIASMQHETQYSRMFQS